MSQCIIVDNSPMSYIFHPDYAIDCSSFIDDPNDVEMWQVKLFPKQQFISTKINLSYFVF